MASAADGDHNTRLIEEKDPFGPPHPTLSAFLFTRLFSRLRSTRPRSQTTLSVGPSTIKRKPGLAITIPDGPTAEEMIHGSPRLPLMSPGNLLETTFQRTKLSLQEIQYMTSRAARGTSSSKTSSNKPLPSSFFSLLRSKFEIKGRRSKSFIHSANHH